MYGGQSYPDFDNDMVEYAKCSFDEILKEKVQDFEFTHDRKPNEQEISNLSQYILNGKLLKVIGQGMQSQLYNLNSMSSRAGSQVPFSSMNIGIPTGNEIEKELSALICKILLEVYNKGMSGMQFIFPNIIFAVKDGVNAKQGDPYYYLYKLACKVASRRGNPTFMSMDAPMTKSYVEKGIRPAIMG